MYCCRLQKDAIRKAIEAVELKRQAEMDAELDATIGRTAWITDEWLQAAIRCYYSSYTLRTTITQEKRSFEPIMGMLTFAMMKMFKCDHFGDETVQVWSIWWC